jgi:hypothetical protein
MCFGTLKELFSNESSLQLWSDSFVKLLVSNFICHFIANLHMLQLDLMHLIITRMYLPVWKRMLFDVKLVWFRDLT